MIKDGIPIVTLLSRTEVNFTSSRTVYIPLILDIVSICAYTIELGWQILWNVVSFKPDPESALNFAGLRHWSNEYCKTQIDLRASRCLLLCSTDASIEYIVQTCPECVRECGFQCCVDVNIEDWTEYYDGNSSQLSTSGNHISSIKCFFFLCYKYYCTRSVTGNRLLLCRDVYSADDRRVWIFHL